METSRLRGGATGQTGRGFCVMNEILGLRLGRDRVAAAARTVSLFSGRRDLLEVSMRRALSRRGPRRSNTRAPAKVRLDAHAHHGAELRGRQGAEEERGELQRRAVGRLKRLVAREEAHDRPEHAEDHGEDDEHRDK